MARPDDALYRIWVEAFALLRKLLPIALLAAVLVGPLFATDPTTGMWLSALCFLLALVGLLLVSRLPLYPAHTFGLEYRFEEEPFEGDGRRCVRCDALAESGIHRRYAKQFVVLGVPLHTFEWGDNDFCDDCAARDPGRSSPGPDRAPDPEPTPADGTPPGSGSGSDPDPDSDRNAERDRRRSRSQRGGRDRSDDSASVATARVDDETPRLERARRVDRTDETTALELKRAFE